MGGHGALTLALRHPERFRSVSAFAPICSPVRAPWGQKAFSRYFGDDRALWEAHDATELMKERRKPFPHGILIDQGLNDPFLQQQLLPHLFEEACIKADQPVTLRRHEGYDPDQAQRQQPGCRAAVEDCFGNCGLTADPGLSQGPIADCRWAPYHDLRAALERNTGGIMLAVISQRAGMVVLCLSLVFTGCSSMPGMHDVQTSVREAESTLAAVQNDPEMKSFGDSMKETKAVFIVTPRHTRGVVLVREEGAQTWNGPAFYTVTSIEPGGRGAGTLGFSAGEQNLDLVALAMTDKAVNWLLSPTLPGKGGLNIVAGTGGSVRGAADMVVFDRSKGAGRAGNLKGTIISIDNTANQAYYGSPVKPTDILVRHSVSNPDAASLRQAVTAAAH